jgi:putative transposase
MKGDKLAVYLHLVWATWDRQALIGPGMERRLYRNIESQAQKLGCKVLALNGMPDHVHLVVKLPSTITVAELVKQVKGVSSHFANETLKLETSFKWQGFYGAFSVSRWDLDKVIGYVKRQKEHHRLDELYPEWEQAFEEVQLEDDSPD